MVSVCFVCELPILSHQTWDTWTCGPGIGPNATNANDIFHEDCLYCCVCMTRLKQVSIGNFPGTSHHCISHNTGQWIGQTNEQQDLLCAAFWRFDRVLWQPRRGFHLQAKRLQTAKSGLCRGPSKELHNVVLCRSRSSMSRSVIPGERQRTARRDEAAVAIQYVHLASFIPNY